MGGYNHSYRPRFPPNKSVYPTAGVVAAPRRLWELGSHSEGIEVHLLRDVNENEDFSTSYIILIYLADLINS